MKSYKRVTTAVAAEIRKLRLQGMPVSEVAERLNTSKATVSNWTTGVFKDHKGHDPISTRTDNQLIRINSLERRLNELTEELRAFEDYVMAPKPKVSLWKRMTRRGT